MSGNKTSAQNEREKQIREADELLFSGPQRLGLGKGLFLGMEFVKNTATKERFPQSMSFGVQVGKRALANGLLCRFDPHWLAFGPALVVTAEQIDEMLTILDRSIGEVLEQVKVAVA